MAEETAEGLVVPKSCILNHIFPCSLLTLSPEPYRLPVKSFPIFPTKNQ